MVMISLVRAWMVFCMIFGVEVGEQKVVIRLVRVGLSGSSMMGAATGMLLTIVIFDPIDSMVFLRNKF